VSVSPSSIDRNAGWLCEALVGRLGELPLADPIEVLKPSARGDDGLTGVDRLDPERAGRPCDQGVRLPEERSVDALAGVEQRERPAAADHRTGRPGLGAPDGVGQLLVQAGRPQPRHRLGGQLDEDDHVGRVVADALDHVVGAGAAELEVGREDRHRLGIGGRCRSSGETERGDREHDGHGAGYRTDEGEATQAAYQRQHGDDDDPGAGDGDHRLNRGHLARGHVEPARREGDGEEQEREAEDGREPATEGAHERAVRPR